MNISFIQRAAKEKGIELANDLGGEHWNASLILAELKEMVKAAVYDILTDEDFEQKQAIRNQKRLDLR